jgi:predicted alpha/beta-hydrolase family hydrolase
MNAYQFKGEVQIPVPDDISLTGDLDIPENAKGIVVFAHGSGSSRHSSRNKRVAEMLQEAGFATLLFDLLTVAEDQDYQTRFNIDLLTERLIQVTGWLKADDRTGGYLVGYFGASTGAAATLIAAANLGDTVMAVVSRGGRPDLAGPLLKEVNAPTLLIVGSLDEQVIELNLQAYALLNGEKEIRIVDGASHLFEEPGKLEEVADLAADWFNQYLVPAVSFSR